MEVKNELFEQAKQAVAEKWHLKDWQDLRFMFRDSPDSIESLHQEAAELYGQWVANEAVKADRKSLVNDSEMAPDNELFIDYQQVGYHDNGAKALDPVISKDILNRPLPFPPKPD